MPAPAVIPALIAYVKVVAVKTLVVGFRSSKPCAGDRVHRSKGRAWRLAMGDVDRMCLWLSPARVSQG